MSYKDYFTCGSLQITLGILLFVCCFIVGPLWLIIWDVVVGVVDVALGVRNIVLGSRKLKECKHERNS